MRRRWSRASVPVLVLMAASTACGDSGSGHGLGVGAGPVSTFPTGPVSTSPGFGAEVGGEWRLVGTGVDEGVAWEIAGKSDGERVCYYAELDPPPSEDFFVDPYAPYGTEPTDVISADGLAEGAEDVLDQFAGCAPVPTELGDDGRALHQLGANDPAAFGVQDLDSLAYHFIDGVVSRDASVVRVTFDDGSTKDVSPVEGHFLAVFPPEREPAEVEVFNERVTVTCRVTGDDVKLAGCGNAALRDEPSNEP